MSLKRPIAPANLTATGSDGQVSLCWTPSAEASSYSIYGGTEGNRQMIRSEWTATSFAHTGLTNGSLYYYIVRACNAGGESDPSNEVSATPQRMTVPEWYYAQDKQRIGPLSLAALAQLLAIGHLRATDMVWRQDQKRRSAGSAVPPPNQHRSPMSDVRIEGTPRYGYWEEIEDDIDPIEDFLGPEKAEALRCEEAVRRARTFDLFLGQHSLADLMLKVRDNSGVREWLHENPGETFFDLLHSLYFPELPFQHPERDQGRDFGESNDLNENNEQISANRRTSIALRRVTDGSVAWPTDLSPSGVPARGIRGLVCLWRYVCEDDLEESRRWLEAHASDLFNLARLVVACEPERCSVGGEEFKYPLRYEENGRVVVEGEPTNQCANDEDHCIECCDCERCYVCNEIEEGEKCNCGECKRCGERVLDDLLCPKCECCPRHCKHRRLEDDEDDEDDPTVRLKIEPLF
jgi:hypothetical protein